MVVVVVVVTVMMIFQTGLNKLKDLVDTLDEDILTQYYRRFEVKWAYRFPSFFGFWGVNA